MATGLVVDTPGKHYRGYVRRHGFVVLSLLILAVVPGATRTAALGGLALATGAYLAGVWSQGRQLRAGRAWLPHAVTAMRGLAAVVVFGLAAGLNGVVLDTSQRWIVLGVLAFIESTDSIDGYLARRLSCNGAFGRIWDMECDAAFMLALSIASWLWAGTFAGVLVFGALRYAYVSVGNRPLALSDPPARYAYVARIVAAVAAVALLFSLVPTVGRALRETVVWTALAALVASFVWDALLQLSADQQTRQ